MRALRVVGLTEDGEVVLEDPVRLERFRVPADERLRAAARGDLSRLGQIAIELESQLRPREIQARIRAGASVEQVAAAAGVPEQKIERFAYPVLLERFRTAENAQRAHPVRADGPDNRTLAEVVAHTFGLRGQAYEGARWDSWKGEDGRWVVALGWRAGRSDNRAHWTFQPGAHGGTVTALDEHASDLVEGLPARPLRTVGAVVDMARPEEEPPPPPSPVEQWRAAASDSYRERMPHVPESARPAVDRGATRTAEPWRPTAPAPRQPEPVEARVAEPRGAYRGDDGRPSTPRETRTTAEWSGERGAATATTAAPPESARPAREQDRPERTVEDRRPGEPARPEQVVPEQARPALHRDEPSTGAPASRADDDVVTGAEPTRAPDDDAVAAAGEPTGAPAEDAAAAESTGAADDQAAAATAKPTAAPADDAATAEPAPAPVDTARPDEKAAPREEVAPVGTPDAPASAAPAADTADPEPSAVPAPADPAPSADPPAADVVTETPAAEAPAAEAPAAKRRTKKGKPAMPSWDEVLLGVRGPR